MMRIILGMAQISTLSRSEIPGFQSIHIVVNMVVRRERASQLAKQIKDIIVEVLSTAIFV